MLTPQPRTLRLNLSDVDCDLLAFDAALSQAESPKIAFPEEPLKRAISLYRGPFLPDCLEEWALTERNVYEQAYLSALERLSRITREKGEPASSVHLLRLLLATDPYRESATCALMQSLADCGDGAAILEVYRNLRLLLHRDLNTEPAPETEALYRNLLSRKPSPTFSFPPSLVAVGLPRRLPVPLTELIGREQEKEEVGGWLKKCRLVTLVGTGGVGKTRLSLSVAEEEIGQFSGGVWFADLAPLSDPALLGQTLLRILELGEEAFSTPERTLESRLSSQTLLLVLDNCEHLLEACALLSHRLLSTCPGLKILATSREALGLTGEHLYPVPALALPPMGTTNGEKAVSALLEYASVKLFVERARQVNSTFHLNRRNAELVARICHRLDGVPLAIEMASARVKTLSIEQITLRLEDRFRLLTGGSRAALPRQRTLQAAIDWSYDLLTEAERVLFRRLCVFAGGWSLEAAEAVCADRNTTEWEALEVLTHLVEKSLVVLKQKSDGTARYRLLESMRQYSAERLVEAEETETFRQRHRDFFLKWAEEIRLHLKGERQAQGLSVLEEEHDNLRVALTYCLEDSQGGEKGLQFGTSLEWFWRIRGYMTEGRVWLLALLSHPGAQKPTPARADVLAGAGAMVWFQSDYAAAYSLYDECLMLRRKLGYRQGIAHALGRLASVVIYQGDYASARSLYEESLAIYRELGDKEGIAPVLSTLASIVNAQGDDHLWHALIEESLTIYRELKDQYGIANVLGNLGRAAQEKGDHALASSLYSESLAIHRELGHQGGIASVLKSMGDADHERGDDAMARSRYGESLRILWKMGDRYNIAFLLERFASLALKETQGERAAQLWGAASALRETIGSPLSPIDLEKQRAEVVEAKQILGEVVFTAAWEKGRTMSLEQMIESALTSQ